MRSVMILISFTLVHCSSEDRLQKLETRVAALEQQRGAPTRRPPAPMEAVNIPSDPLDVRRGKGKAVLVEAFDFACPYCAMSAKVLDELVQKHGADVTVVSKQFVVHPDTATLPALAACAANKQQKGPEFETALWQRAWKWDSGSPRFDGSQTQAPALDELAKSIGLDVVKFKADRDGQECKSYHERQQQQLAAAGVRGTPSLFVNGKPYQGPRTVDALHAALMQ